MMIAKNSLKALWLSLLICLVIMAVIGPAGYFAIPGLSVGLIPVSLVGTAVWVYLTTRVLGFNRKLTRVLRRLLAGDYEVGIETKIQDELSGFAKQLNRLGEQLRTYDKLRAEKVSLSYRALDLIYRAVSQGVIIADLEKRTLKLNPVVQSLFNVKQESFSLESIESQEKNKEFMALFNQVAEQKTAVGEGAVVLQLPMRDSARKASVKIIPLKDAEEAVKLAIIFLDVHKPPGRARAT